MKKIYLIFVIFVSSIICISCESPTNTTPYKEEQIVEGLLKVGRGIRDFRLTRTLPVGSVYDSTKAGITDAEIIIHGADGTSTRLRPVSDHPGLYNDRNFVVKPRTEYSMSINYKGNEIFAKTITPDTFRVSMISGSSFIYLLDKINIEWSESAGAAAYFISVTNLEESQSLENIDRQFSSDDPYSRRRTRFYWTLGTETEIFPWLHNYFGEHEIRIYAVDSNFLNYLQTSFQDVQLLTEPESNVANAIGYFGSAVLHSRVYMLRKP